MNPDDKVLNKYDLSHQLPGGDASYERWQAYDEFGGPVLVKAWLFNQEKPSKVERALWNIELRNLFRLSSLPNVDEHLVVLHDAGLDIEQKSFILVLYTPGFSVLDSLLQEQSRPDWLTQLNQFGVRTDLWFGFRRLVYGLKQIHQLRMIHRAIFPRAVLVDLAAGPDSFRLDGGDLLMRVGGDGVTMADMNQAWLTDVDQTFSFDNDWFHMGMLMARLLHARVNHGMDLESVLSQINDSEQLVREEKDLINRLINKNKLARLTMADEVIRLIDRVVVNLGRQGQHYRHEDYLGLVVTLGPGRVVTDGINVTDPTIFHDDIEAQRQFIQEDLYQPRLVPSHGDDKVFTLVGQRMCYRIREHLSPTSGQARHALIGGKWDLAFCASPTELRYSDDENQMQLEIPIKVFTPREVNKSFNNIKNGAVSWRPHLFPDSRQSKRIDEKQLQRLHDFFRLTNQLELLMLDAELYPYWIEDEGEKGGARILKIQENREDTYEPWYADKREKLVDFLADEGQKNDRGLVHLSDVSSLGMGRMVPKSEFWVVDDIDKTNQTITLRRIIERSLPSAPQKGVLRTFGMFGQMSLIKRRRKAIDRLENHAYLLRALGKPASTRLHVGSGDLPIKVDPKKIDDAKKSAMESIWSTRPLFVLQGPPGTGKTTLVANLLAQVFKDDPVAQVLVTAQAHAAVDVLREKVNTEFESSVEAEEVEPLMVRLAKQKEDQRYDPNYVESVAEQVLNQAVSELGDLKKQNRTTPLQNRWLQAAREAAAVVRSRNPNGLANDFKELIKRSAGITYCTSTAGNLAELADSTQTFDWSIVEEAGKAHGFDLVLPLQTGHRWLLIGDQKQLDPYRYDDFFRALNNLDAALEALQVLPGGAGGQIDRELIKRWEKYDELEKMDCEKSWKSWLNFFSYLHDACARVDPHYSSDDPTRSSNKAMAKMLNQQHRMHPTIAELVSKAYYRGQIKSMTVDGKGQPLPRVVHPFVAPKLIQGKAIVWIDVPWVGQSNHGQRQENHYVSEVEGHAIMTLLKELDCQAGQTMSLALLTPYRKQRQMLNEQLKNLELPNWMKLPGKQQDGQDKPNLEAKTVDSFQGDQADVVVVSLVRNNRKSPENGLGFLSKNERMNVLFSRAERLLVLVGSWDFFNYQVQNSSRDPDRSYGSWKIAIDYLQHCFENQLAVKIAAENILQEQQS